MRAWILLALAACSPYDPQLEEAPYFCGPTEPRCPTGYVCRQRGATDAGAEVCIKANGEVPLDSLFCTDDSTMEPNDTIAKATAETAKHTEVSASVCNSGDHDLYKLTIAEGEHLDLVVQYEGAGAHLDAAILNEAGVPIAHAGPIDGVANAIRANADGLAAGTYYASVFDDEGGSNNYKATIDIR